jgi:hypothetical protein
MPVYGTPFSQSQPTLPGRDIPITVDPTVIKVLEHLSHCRIFTFFLPTFTVPSPFWIVWGTLWIVLCTSVLGGVLFALLFIPPKLPILLALAVLRHLVLRLRDCIRLDGNDRTYTYILPHPGSMCQDTYTYQSDGRDADLVPSRALSYRMISLRAPFFARCVAVVMRMSGLPRIHPLRFPSVPDHFPFHIVGQVIGLTCLCDYRDESFGDVCGVALETEIVRLWCVMDLSVVICLRVCGG